MALIAMISRVDEPLRPAGVAVLINGAAKPSPRIIACPSKAGPETQVATLSVGLKTTLGGGCCALAASGHAAAAPPSSVTKSRRFIDFFPSRPTTPTMGYMASSGKHCAVRQDGALLSDGSKREIPFHGRMSASTECRRLAKAVPQ